MSEEHANRITDEYRMGADLVMEVVLDGPAYVVHGEFKRGERAASKLLSGFGVDVASALMPKP